MSIFRIRYETRGKHTQLRLFVSESGIDGTWQLAGRFCLRNSEFHEFRSQFEQHIGFLPEPWQAVQENKPIENPDAKA